MGLVSLEAALREVGRVSITEPAGEGFQAVVTGTNPGVGNKTVLVDVVVEPNQYRVHASDVTGTDNNGIALKTHNGRPRTIYDVSVPHQDGGEPSHDHLIAVLRAYFRAGNGNYGSNASIVDVMNA